MEQIKKIYSYLIVICFFLTNIILLTSICYSESNLKIGLLEIHPNASVKAVNDDNIYLSATNPKSSLITTPSLGINFFLPKDANKLGINYNFENLNYSHASSTNDATHQTINFLFDWQFPAGFSIKLLDNYRDTTDPPYSEFVRRIKRKQNDALFNLLYKFGKYISVGGGYFQVLYDYTQEEYKPKLNRIETETDVTILYNISPKTFILLESGSGIIDYADITNKNDSKNEIIRVGVKGELTPKTAGEMKFGQQSRKYDQITNKDFTTSVFVFSTLTKFSEMSNLKLFLHRGTFESIYQTNNYYISTGLNVELNHNLSQKFSSKISIGYENGYYPEETTEGNLTQKRQDTSTRFGLGLKFNISDWLSFGIDTNIRNRDSNFSAYNFSNNITGISIGTIF